MAPTDAELLRLALHAEFLERLEADFEPGPNCGFRAVSGLILAGNSANMRKNNPSDAAQIGQGTLEKHLMQLKAWSPNNHR
jgi:hypothetical protein